MQLAILVGLAHGLAPLIRCHGGMLAVGTIGVSCAGTLGPCLRSVGVDMKLQDDGVLGVGIIGAGRIGMVHLEALSSCERAKAVIISNPTVSKAKAAAARYKLDHFTGDASDVITHPDVEAVWI